MRVPIRPFVFRRFESCGQEKSTLRFVRWMFSLLVLASSASLNAEPTEEELEAASRLASRATFGMSYEEIHAMAEQGLDAWLDEQLDMQCSFLIPVEDELWRMAADGEFNEYSQLTGEEENWLPFNPFDSAWTNRILEAPDQLCQRVAWALSQIFVISQQFLEGEPYQFTAYYDILIRNAFGNYRDLIEEVTFSSQMGSMLSHLFNSRGRPEKRIYPDQNYAREIMQLFSIGLFELNSDGSKKLDKDDKTIPTYDSGDIAELSRVMTGLGLTNEYSGWNNHHHDKDSSRSPMMMYPYFHDVDQKTIVGDYTIGAGYEGKEEINLALDHLAAHENVGPFIGKQLIQRLVTSNPDPQYVHRVAMAWEDDGEGNRGNLKHVIKTILTDEETKNPLNPDSFGKIKEPLIRIVNLHRMFPVKALDETDQRGYSDELSSWFPEFDFPDIEQHPLGAHSVFNFYSPNFSPQGLLGDNKLVAPELQIFHMRTVVQQYNVIFDMLMFRDSLVGVRPHYHDENDLNDDGDPIWKRWGPSFAFDFTGYLELAENPEKLVDRLDLVMCYGRLQRLSPDLRETLIRRVRQTDEREDEGRANDHRYLDRVAFAIWYISMLPEFFVET